MEIRLCLESDEAQLFDMMMEEGADWECYYGKAVIEKYKQALAASITCVAFHKDNLCGYVRCRDDNGFGIYVYDLLVRRSYRGQGIGRKLLEFVGNKYPEDTVYVMSDADAYYKKLGCLLKGSIFEVNLSNSENHTREGGQ